MELVGMVVVGLVSTSVVDMVEWFTGGNVTDGD